MKKCPYCAEEIQDEALICRYCHKDLTPQKKQWSVFWHASLLGFGFSLIAFSYYFNKAYDITRPDDTSVFVMPLIYTGITFLSWAFIYSFIVWLKRSFYKRSENVRVFSNETGFLSLIVFGLSLVIYVSLISRAVSYFSPIPLESPTTFIEPTSSIKKITQIIIPTPKKTQSKPPCTLWSDVKASDIGKKLCVYGKVRNSYYSEQLGAYVITYSGDPEALYLIMYGNWYFDSLDGKYAGYTGEINQVYNTLVMYLPEGESIQIWHISGD